MARRRTQRGCSVCQQSRTVSRWTTTISAPTSTVKSRRTRSANTGKPYRAEEPCARTWLLAVGGRFVERKIRIGLVGCGVVGTGILELLRDNAAHIEGRLGAHIEVRHVVVGDMTKPRSAVVPRELLTTDPQRVLDDPDVDIVVEVMGGVEKAGAIVRGALERGKHVVTANKALLAEQGDELLQMAEE